LDSVQYKALLIATGGMKGTSLSALLAECGEKLLEFRRNEIILKYLIKIKYISSNSAKQILNDQICPNLNCKFISIFNPILNKFLITISNLEVDLVLPVVSSHLRYELKVDISFKNKTSNLQKLKFVIKSMS
jgi:hypothetical protein